MPHWTRSFASNRVVFNRYPYYVPRHTALGPSDHRPLALFALFVARSSYSSLSLSPPIYLFRAQEQRHAFTFLWQLGGHLEHGWTLTLRAENKSPAHRGWLVLSVCLPSSSSPRLPPCCLLGFFFARQEGAGGWKGGHLTHISVLNNASSFVPWTGLALHACVGFAAIVPSRKRVSRGSIDFWKVSNSFFLPFFLIVF